VSGAKKAFTIRYGGVTDVGKVRGENEDAFEIDEQSDLFVVSDGMGGHAEGATAAQLVIEALPQILNEQLGRLRSSSSKSIRRAIHKSIIKLDRQIRKEGAGDTGHENMGATMVMAMVRGGRVFTANVGDSRAYLFRKNRLRQLSQEHTMVAEMIENGEIQEEHAENHPAGHIITQCIGVDAEVKPHVRSLSLQKSDRLLLCSDGLTDMVNDEAIAAILGEVAEPQAICGRLVEAANSAGGEDNITAVVVELQ
jgi:protein phosphatase